MSPSSGPRGTAIVAHTQGWVVMAHFLCQGPEAPPAGSSKAWGEAGSAQVCNQPFPRAAEWRRGDGGGRAGGGLWAHRQRETAQNKHQREEPVSEEEMNQTAK